MTTFVGKVLSGSTDGRPIPVAAAATPGTLIHTAVTGANNYDEIFMFASNVTATAATLTIEWGGVTDPGDHLQKAVSIPPNSYAIPVVTGQRLQNGLMVKAFSGTASALNITGFVNRAQ